MPGNWSWEISRRRNGGARFLRHLELVRASGVCGQGSDPKPATDTPKMIATPLGTSANFRLVS
eukprot:11399433-Heterocapsa_arctica.AAC.1